LATVAEEKEAREDAVSKQMRVLRKELPTLLARREPIPDPRDPRKRRHKLTSLLLYGLLMFVFPFSSRRETHRELSRPQFMANLQLLFPEIDTLPHADTLFRLLRDIDLEHLEQARGHRSGQADPALGRATPAAARRTLRQRAGDAALP
jgi:hypothetical protein